jgi:hypothetical protein
MPGSEPEKVPQQRPEGLAAPIGAGVETGRKGAVKALIDIGGERLRRSRIPRPRPLPNGPRNPDQVADPADVNEEGWQSGRLRRLAKPLSGL